MKLIGLIGFAGSGKDSVFGILHNIDAQIIRYAFADALKAEVAEAFDVTPEFINENKPNFRELLQAWGVTRRSFNPDYWVEQTAKSVLEDCPKVAVLTDVRFTNEAQWIRDNGGLLVRVLRKGNEAANGHISEHELADYPTGWIIENNGTLDGLSEEVVRFWEACIY